MNPNIDREVARRRAQGFEPTTMAGIRQELANIGYKLAEYADGTTRIVSGDGAGDTYPARNYAVVEADTGISAFHYKDARRDDNFRKLQELRFQEWPYAVVRGRIVGI